MGADRHDPYPARDPPAALFERVSCEYPFETPWVYLCTWSRGVAKPKKQRSETVRLREAEGPLCYLVNSADERCRCRGPDY